MDWLTLILGVLKLVNHITQVLAEKKLIDGAVAKVLLENHLETMERVKKAMAARNSVKPDVLSDDPYNRDR